MVVNCPSPVKITIIDEAPIEALESDSEEFTYQVDEEVGDNFDNDHEPSKDNIKHYSFRPRLPIDLIPMADHYRISMSTSSFVTHMHDSHKKISDKIE